MARVQTGEKNLVQGLSASSTLELMLSLLIFLTYAIPASISYSPVPFRLPSPHQTVLQFPPTPQTSLPPFTSFLLPLSESNKAYALVDLPPAPTTTALLPNITSIPLIIISSKTTYHQPKTSDSTQTASQLAASLNPNTSVLAAWLDYIFFAYGALPKVVMHRYDIPNLLRPHVSHVLDGDGPWVVTERSGEFEVSRNSDGGTRDGSLAGRLSPQLVATTRQAVKRAAGDRSNTGRAVHQKTRRISASSYRDRLLISRLFAASKLRFSRRSRRV